MSLGRRKHVRILAEDGDVGHPEYKCLNISEGGMKFHSARKVTPGKEFEVVLNLFEEPVTIKCKVIWCQGSALVYEEGFHMGVKFVDFSVIDQLRLRAIISERE